MDESKKWSNISKMFKKILRGEGVEGSATKALYQAAVEAGATFEEQDEILIQEAILTMTPEELENFHLLLLEEQHRSDEELGKSVE